MINYISLYIWLVVDLPLWKIWKSVSWDDYSTYMGKLKMFQATSQFWVVVSLTIRAILPFWAVIHDNDNDNDDNDNDNDNGN